MKSGKQKKNQEQQKTPEKQNKTKNEVYKQKDKKCLVSWALDSLSVFLTQGLETPLKLVKDFYVFLCQSTSSNALS